jgi:hypothetical protein
MDEGILAAWLIGEGIVIYNSHKANKYLPVPGQLLAVSGLFAMLGLLAIPQPGLATLLAVGLDVAAFMKLAPAITAGEQGGGK